MEQCSTNAHSNRVRRILQRRAERQQIGEYLAWPEENGQQTNHRPDTREASSDQRASMASHDG